MASNEAQHREKEEENAPAEDEDTGAQVAPIVRLQKVAVTTGEEEEDAILDLKAKLYRFDKGGKQWKERGVGNVKLLKHKDSGKVRLVMRQSKTLKICANHLVVPTMKVQEHTGNDKSCIWHAADFADGELKDELFCIRFASVENCKTFMAKVEEVAETEGKKEDASDTTRLLEKLSVRDGIPKGKELEENAAASKAVGEHAKPEGDKTDEPAS
ncbi:ran-binding protein 1 homolog a-like [Corylus avellana]|uniref:ran-binding protein 1 homolog a-like n=1 Tax=Corylus avellana TaxID=13451 RepID=UPI001E21261E|nr:ran-binding protein 1 homolog a-like [Corylus avellana]XP_059462878.1 ran-binding protein 1 homolog a-like [Corylus avellana]XP_059462879.1 ran-binding protein 1 homolog a-like [Corylus avellana]